MLNRSLLVLIFGTMLAFAANSVLGRIALKAEHIDPVTFSNLRLISGALVLIPLLLKHRGNGSINWSPISAFFLMIYVVFFSIAYINLNTGTGALLLFGVVQLTMVTHGIFKGEKLTLLRIAGLFLAVIGMLVLLLPGADTPSLKSSVLMMIAGFSWAAYSILGQETIKPGITTAKNFLFATPMALILFILNFLTGSSIHADPIGISLALLSGTVASAGAYIVWYSILPKLESVTASTIQLSVPCLAILCGVIFLNEPLSLRITFSTLLVVVGIFLVLQIKQNDANS